MIGAAEVLSEAIEREAVAFDGMVPIHMKRKSSGSSVDTEIGFMHVQFSATFRSKESPKHSTPTSAPVSTAVPSTYLSTTTSKVSLQKSGGNACCGISNKNVH